MCRPAADSIELFILIAFAIVILFLAQSRELMRQIARTAEEWHRMRDAMRGSRRRDVGSREAGGIDDGDESNPARPDEPDDR